MLWQRRQTVPGGGKRLPQKGLMRETKTEWLERGLEEWKPEQQEPTEQEPTEQETAQQNVPERKPV